MRRRGRSLTLRALCAVLLVAGFPLAAQAATAPAADALSPAAKGFADWVIQSDDHQGLPFVIVDKVGARVLAFDSEGRLVDTAPVLLGAAQGDDSPPGIGDRALSAIGPEDRITPAGRFVAAPGRNLKGKAILWVDYAAALSLHPVIEGKPTDRRLERLATPTTADNRISYGCINVPVSFFEKTVAPLFTAGAGIVYILPERRSIAEVFFGKTLTAR